MILLAGLLLLLLAIFAITLIPEAEAKYNLRELPEDFVRAVHGLNLSVNSLIGGQVVNLEDEMGSLAKRLLKVHEERAFKGRLGELLNEASFSYSKLAEAAKYVSRLSAQLSEERKILDRMFEYLENCSIERAKELSDKLDLDPLIREVEAALTSLDQVNETALLSEEHRSTYRRSKDILKKVYSMLIELKKVKDLLEEDPRVLRELCLARKLGRSPDPSLSYGRALSKLKGLDPSKGYSYSFEILQVKSWLNDGTGRGTGAGTWYPESDD